MNKRHLKKNPSGCISCQFDRCGFLQRMKRFYFESSDLFVRVFTRFLNRLIPGTGLMLLGHSTWPDGELVKNGRFFVLGDNAQALALTSNTRLSNRAR